MENFKNLIRNTSKAQKTLFIVIIAVLIGVIIISAININNHKTVISITNSSKYLSAAPNKAKNVLNDTIWNLLKNTLHLPEGSKITDITIREDSFNQNTSGEITTTSFLIDIDSLEQTYRVSFPYSSSGILPDGVTVNCPSPSESKYPNTKCVGMYDTSTTAQANKLLPYESNRFNINLEVTSETPVLNIIIKTCSEQIFQQYQKEALNWLAQHGINTSDYQIEYYYSRPCA